MTPSGRNPNVFVLVAKSETELGLEQHELAGSYNCAAIDLVDAPDGGAGDGGGGGGSMMPPPIGPGRP